MTRSVKALLRVLLAMILFADCALVEDKTSGSGNGGLSDDGDDDAQQKTA